MALILKVVTHDWPSGITSFGNVNWLINIKPHFEEDIKNGELGNPVTMDLLRVCFFIRYNI